MFAVPPLVGFDGMARGDSQSPDGALTIRRKRPKCVDQAAFSFSRTPASLCERMLGVWSADRRGRALDPERRFPRACVNRCSDRTIVLALVRLLSKPSVRKVLQVLSPIFLSNHDDGSLRSDTRSVPSRRRRFVSIHRLDLALQGVDRPIFDDGVYGGAAPGGRVAGRRRRAGAGRGGRSIGQSRARPPRAGRRTSPHLSGRTSGGRITEGAPRSRPRADERCGSADS